MKKILLMAVMSLFTLAVAAENRKGEDINLKSAEKKILNVFIDNHPMRVEWYVDNYVKYPNRFLWD